ncbi:MAG TPA: hypothetical protein VN822_11805 [Candidatus Acidoferrales bacterium]|nr:hypothetical protein [Candidatus Acidoferrales bacterium]
MESAGLMMWLTAKPLRGLLAGAAVGVVAYTCIAIIPIYVKAYEFRNAAYKETQLAVTNAESADRIRDTLYQKAQALDLPVEEDEIKAESSVNSAPIGTVTSLMDDSAPTHQTADVDIEVSYAVPVKFPGHTFYLKFEIHERDDSGTIDR